MMLATYLATLVLAIGATAYPAGSSVTPLKDCSALPRWNNNTNIAGPWTILVDSCTNATAAGGACSIKGFPASSDVKTSAQEKGIESGSITIASGPHSSGPNSGKTLLRCNGDLNTFEAKVPSGAGALDWHAIEINKGSNTGDMEWGLASRDTEPITVWRKSHAGSPLESFFLGSSNQTDWAVRHSGAGLSSVDRRPFWFLRLLSPDTSMWSDEYRAQIRIDGH